MIRKNIKQMKILSGMLALLTISSAVSLTPKTFAAATLEKEETSTLKKVKDFISKPVTAMAIGAAVTSGAIFAALKLMSEDESQNDIPGPSINNEIRGIQNLGNSCYLNSALQQLYTMEHFRNKVLNFDTTRLDENNKDHRILIAVKIIFEYLQGTRNLTYKEIENLMWNYLGYTGHQEDSADKFMSLKEACERSFKNGKPSSSIPLSEHFASQIEIPLNKDLHTIQEAIQLSLTRRTPDDIMDDGDYRGSRDDAQRICNAEHKILKIKEDQLFCINLMQRYDSKRQVLTVDENLTFTTVDNYLYIVNKYKNQPTSQSKTFNCELVSATIQQGNQYSGHYFIYKKIGSSWFEINDSQVYKKQWKDIQEDIGKNSSFLIYRLKNSY